MLQGLPDNATDATAERLLIGCFFADPTLLLTCEVEADDFSDIRARLLFDKMRELADEGHTPDEVTVMAAIEGHARESEMLGYIVETWSGGVENIDLWLGRVHEARRVRELAIALDDTRHRAILEGQAADESIAQLTQRIERVSRRNRLEHVSGEQLLDQAGKTWRDRVKAYKNADVIVRGVPTCIDELDDVIGGLVVGAPSIVAAKPGGGKTTFLFDMLARLAGRGIPVLYMSNEDTSDPLGTTALAFASGIDRSKIRDGKTNPMENMEIESAIEGARASWAPNWLAVYVHGWKMARIVRVASALIRRTKAKVVALDYIQNVPNPEPKMQRTYGIEENMTLWETMLAEHNVAGPLGSQLKRHEGIPTMEHLKDSSSLDQKAKQILALHATAAQIDKDLVDIVVLKQNEGLVGNVENVRYVRSASRIG